MNKQYPYRFKTEDEFIKEFGENWITYIYDMCNGYGYWIIDEMDHLLGKVYEYHIEKNDNHLPSINNFIESFSIKWYMLTENIRVPNYKPRKIIRE